MSPAAPEIVVQIYVAADGSSPFEKWFAEVDTLARSRISIARVRLAIGNVSNVKSIGDGVLEHRINWGPGYRLYFGRDGDALVIPLIAETKPRQMRDVANAKTLWSDYGKRRQIAR